VVVGLLLLVLACVAPQASSAGSPQAGNSKQPPGYFERHYNRCGEAANGELRAQIGAFKVSCRKARRIVESYMRHGWPGYVKIKGFPAWKCSSGSEGGTCQWGRKYSSQAPEISFNWVP
jgi:hypothetical protein